MEMTLNENSQKTYRNLFFLVLAISTLFRLAIAGRFGFGADEAHYVMYSRHLAWGYFDHPPMVAFLAALTGTLGKSLFFARLGPIICSAVSLIILRYLSLSLYRDERISFWAIVLLLLMPYQHLLMVALLPDSTLNVFWCSTLLAAWCAIREGRWIEWILAGILFGGALLSKYHAILLPLCLFCYLLNSPQHRFWLGKIQPYVASLIGLIVFLPNIIWNARHDWISYSYQLAHGGGINFKIEKIFKVFGGQLGVWSPVIFCLLIASLIYLFRHKSINDADRFVLWTSMPVFIFFCSIGLFGKILPHWTSVGWWTGSLAVVVVAFKKISRKGKTGITWRRWSVAAAVIGFIMTSVLYTSLFVPVVSPVYSKARTISIRLHQQFPAIKPLEPYKPEYDISNGLFGWEHIAAKVEKIREKMPCPDKTFIFGHRFFTISKIAVYLNYDTVATILHRKNNQYRLWFSPEDHLGWDALFIDDGRHYKDSVRYRSLFGKVDQEPEIIKVYRKGFLANEIRVYKYYAFKGKYEEK